MIGLSNALVEPRELFTSIGATGRIEFDPSGERSVTAWTAGRIERLPVSAEGQEVSPGTILMDIYSPELYVAQQELLVLADGQRLLGEEGLEAAKEKLRLLGVTEVQMERVMESGTAVSTFPVFSPVSGTVTGVYVREGDQVTRGQHLMDVADLSTVWLTVFLTEDQAGLVGPGQSAGFTLDAHPGVEYSGTVESVVPFLDGPGGSAEARVTLPNPAGDLLPGQTAAVTFTGSGYGSVLSVPRNSVLSLGERSLVYVLTAPLSYPEPDEGRLRIEEARFEPREVVVGVLSTDAEGNRYYPVLQGLEQGDVVALDGAFLIDSQAELTGLPSLLDPDGRG
jgi:Cu(I)/Ag(I) efflux system membrane fusion protein